MSNIGRPTTWVYTLRKNSKGSQLAVPKEVSNQIPDGSLFRLEVTPEGLLYRYTAQVDRTQASVEIPWVQKITTSSNYTRTTKGDTE